eukprot:scaffold14.g1106.t1
MEGPLVLISSAKGERRTLKAGLKKLVRHLRAARCEVARLDAGAGVRGEALAAAAILVLACPTRPFSLEELDALRTYLEDGGSLLVLGSEGGEAASGSNLNYMLEEHGLAIADDSVIQSAFSKYLHPRQVLVDGGLLSPDMAAYCAGARCGGTGAAGATEGASAGAGALPPVEFAYPHGATVVVQAPAAAILSSGRTAHPFNMAIGGAWWRDDGGAGRLAVLGSCHMFDDEWLDKDANTAVLVRGLGRGRRDFILGWMLRDPACKLPRRTLAEPEILDVRPVTHVDELAKQPLVMLQASAAYPPPLPADFTSLFSTSLFKLDLSLVPEVGRLYQQLGVPRKRLQLWRPELEVPFPPLQPAVFPPMLREPPPPPLELFDLDEEFAGHLERLSRITARYMSRGGPLGAQQLEEYIRECGALLGLRSARGGGASAKEQLAEVLHAVVACKMADACG